MKAIPYLLFALSFPMYGFAFMQLIHLHLLMTFVLTVAATAMLMAPRATKAIKA